MGNDCACIHVDYDFSVDMIRDEDRVAASRLKCSECSGYIERGETYRHESYRTPKRHYPFKGEGGELRIHRTCLDCKSIRDFFFCDGWTFGDVWEDVSNYIDEMGGEVFCCDLSKLTRQAREMFLEAVEEYWRENPDEDEEES